MSTLLLQISQKLSIDWDDAETSSYADPTLFGVRIILTLDTSFDTSLDSRSLLTVARESCILLPEVEQIIDLCRSQVECPFLQLHQAQLSLVDTDKFGSEFDRGQ